MSPLLQRVSPLRHLRSCLYNAACAAWVQHSKQAAPLCPSSALWPALLVVLQLQASWLLHLHAFLCAAAGLCLPWLLPVLICVPLPVLAALTSPKNMRQVQLEVH